MVSADDVTRTCTCHVVGAHYHVVGVHLHVVGAHLRVVGAHLRVVELHRCVVVSMYEKWLESALSKSK